jgi:hypothetical protein
MKDTRKSAKSSTASDKKFEGFTDEERGAMKERAQELKAAARRGPGAAEADGESAVLAKIAEMPESDRAMGERLHAVIKASAPALPPKLWPLDSVAIAAARCHALRKANRSALMVSACVVGMPCGKPL